MLRIGLFLATNAAVLFVLSIVLNVLGLNQPGQGSGGKRGGAAQQAARHPVVREVVSNRMPARCCGKVCY